MQFRMFVNVKIPIKWKYSVKPKKLRNPKNPQSMGNVKLHTMGILWGKLIYYHTMGFQ